MALFVPGHRTPGPLGDFGHSTCPYLLTLGGHIDDSLEQGTDVQEAIRSLDQSPLHKVADFDALSGRNAHQVFLKREAAAFE